MTWRLLAERPTGRIRLAYGIMAIPVVVPLFAMPVPARAQTGWSKPIQKYVDALKASLPTINQPQPDWQKVTDLKQTDGTVAVPACGDPDVVATVREGILESLNAPFASVITAQGGEKMFNKVDMGPVWVHPALSGGYVCDTTITVPEMKIINGGRWKFETFAEDGKARVFYYNEDDQPPG